MTMRPISRPFLPKQLPLAVIALVICSSCTMPAMPPSHEIRTSPSRSERPSATRSKPSPPTIKRSNSARPDPRYRPPANFSELHAVAGEVAKASRREIHWRLALGKNPGPLARITGGLDDCTIFLHPVGARQVPPNTWAFIIGHEFAHRIENLGAHSQTNPSNELKADIAGARYAMSAGYRLEAFLGWVLTEPNQASNSHGSLHKRVHAIATHFRIPENVIQREAQRYSNDRAVR